MPKLPTEGGERGWGGEHWALFNFCCPELWVTRIDSSNGVMESATDREKETDRQLYEAFLNSKLVYSAFDGSPLDALMEERDAAEKLAICIADSHDTVTLQENYDNVTCELSFILSLLGKNNNVEGVRVFFGIKFYAPSVILTIGTFISGKIWVGRTSIPAGRAGESASLGLAENLQQLGFETDRLKTGTPRVEMMRSFFLILFACPLHFMALDVGKQSQYSALEDEEIPPKAEQEGILVSFLPRRNHSSIRLEDAGLAALPHTGLIEQFEGA
ncbi:MnmG, N-terminal domain [Dillenia turbinata]|uniref:MnmG, N-terminal domain n=1 Tax=Dillenia turbinata TaxID=194707 RepID=A0AAN8UTA3_9MAGN